MARDYKNAKRSGGKSSGSVNFIVGLALGLAVAAGVHVYDKQAFEKQQRLAHTDTNAQQKEEKPAPASQSAEPQAQLDFYEMLPKFEVTVPEKDKDIQRNTPGTRVEKPGAYILQAGSYRSYPDADRIRAMLALQGVESKVSKVTIDADTWHRVRIGPIRDLKSLDETRRKLREAQIDAIVIRVGD
ncbi:MAG TPA: SPOR domain-containing protein [Steroidobacteraceae bacterium]|nr:SPOR domain-containing protein [Steroidobacteraceae bacterium]